MAWFKCDCGTEVEVDLVGYKMTGSMSRVIVRHAGCSGPMELKGMWPDEVPDEEED